MTLSELERKVGANPENAALRHLLGAHYAQAGRVDEAERELYRAISLDPQVHLARMQLAMLYLTKGDVHRATSTLGPLESLEDADALKSFKRGLEALIRNDIAGCVRWLNRGIAQNQVNAALNDDMRKVLARLAAHDKPHDQPHAADRVGAEHQVEIAPAKEEPSKVRTDFSLYGTRH